MNKSCLCMSGNKCSVRLTSDVHVKGYNWCAGCQFLKRLHLSHSRRNHRHCNMTSRERVIAVPGKIGRLV